MGGAGGACRARACSFAAAHGTASPAVREAIAFAVTRQLPRRAVTGVQLLRTPLLWRQGCTVLVVRSPGLHSCSCPGYALQAQALAAVLMEGSA